MGLDVNIPLHIDKEGISHAVLKSAYDNTVGSGRVISTTISAALLQTISSTKSDTLVKAVVLAGLSSTIFPLLYLVSMMVMSARPLML